MDEIVIPIEIKVREFDGKIWLAANLIKQKKSVVIGPGPEIKQVLDIIKPDVYISKDPGDGNIEFFDKLRSAGVSICGLDPEGAVTSMDKLAYNKQDVLNHIDALFSWGKIPTNAVRSHYNNINNIFVTGNPRFDLLQPQLRYFYEEQATNLSKEYNNYILINGNFTLANPNSQLLISKRENVYGSISQDELTYENRIFHRFIDSIFHLQNEYPETDIIIRPHPSESNTTYEKTFHSYDHINVEASGDVRTWIAGAAVTLHHDCTTGIESALMEVPTVSYRPIQNNDYEVYLPQAVSENAFSLDELTNCLSQYLRGDKPYKLDTEQISHLKKYIHNIDESAAIKICSIINSLETPNEKNHNKLKPDLKGSIERKVKSSKYSNNVQIIYDEVQKAVGDELNSKKRQRYKEKFPSLKEKEIQERIEQIEQELEVGPISISQVPLTNNTYYIRPK